MTWTVFYTAFPFLLQKSCLVVGRCVVPKASLLRAIFLIFGNSRFSRELYWIFSSQALAVAVSEKSYWNLVRLLDDTFFIFLLLFFIIIIRSWNLVWLLDDTSPVSLLKTAPTGARTFVPMLTCVNNKQNKIILSLI